MYFFKCLINWLASRNIQKSLRMPSDIFYRARELIYSVIAVCESSIATSFRVAVRRCLRVFNDQTENSSILVRAVWDWQGCRKFVFNDGLSTRTRENLNVRDARVSKKKNRPGRWTRSRWSRWFRLDLEYLQNVRMRRKNILRIVSQVVDLHNVIA